MSLAATESAYAAPQVAREIGNLHGLMEDSKDPQAAKGDPEKAARLKEAMAEANVTARFLREQLGAVEKSTENWLAGIGPGTENNRLIANLCGVRSTWLQTGKGPKYPPRRELLDEMQKDVQATRKDVQEALRLLQSLFDPKAARPAFEQLLSRDDPKRPPQADSSESDAPSRPKADQ